MKACGAGHRRVVPARNRPYNPSTVDNLINLGDEACSGAPLQAPCRELTHFFAWSSSRDKGDEGGHDVL